MQRLRLWVLGLSAFSLGAFGLAAPLANQEHPTAQAPAYSSVKYEEIKWERIFPLRHFFFLSNFMKNPTPTYYFVNII